MKGKDSIPVDESMILNLSEKVLTQHQKEVLTLGPNFVPTPPKAHIAKRDEDIDTWINKIRWAYFFSKHANKTDDSPNPHKEAEIELIPPSGRTAP